jgi:hypothetical protein
MTDVEFITAFETCELPKEDFHHRDHLRLAWIYLRQYGHPQAARKIAESIRRYAAHLNASQKYHETITIAWLELVDFAQQSLPAAASFDDLPQAFPELLQKNALAEYYSSGVLESETAKRIFVPPDLRPFRPAPCANGSIAK